jgi:hypothetical protein
MWLYFLTSATTDKYNHMKATCSTADCVALHASAVRLGSTQP